MFRQLGLVAALLLIACSSDGAPDAAGTASREVDAQSRLIVQAADTFLGTLSDEQRRQAVYVWSNDEQRRNWSNLPEGIVRRGGVKWGDLNEAQRSALMALLDTVLSDEGVEMVRQQMLADSAVAAQPRSQGGRGPTFGADYYFISFLGEPSTDLPWMLQFGGHHLAINATVAGPNVTLSPTLTGGQPLRFEAEGRQVFLTKDEIDAAHALMASLSPEQRSQAVVSNERGQLQLGPGQDGRTIAAAGIQASAFNAAQRERLMALIQARLVMLNADDRTPLMREIASQLDQTTFGWWGPVTEGEPAYWRVVGPTMVLEYSTQDREHAHNIYRDPRNDYGAAWATN